MAEDLALELDHDRMLLRLCSAMGIESEPARFANPLAERARLEELLRWRRRRLPDARRQRRAGSPSPERNDGRADRHAPDGPDHVPGGTADFRSARTAA